MELHDKLRENSINSSKFKESIIGTKEEVNNYISSFYDKHNTK